MAVSHLDRRLLAILAADVVGYSRVMEADEPGTIARLQAIRTELAEPLVAEHHGRIVKLMSDGVLVVFESMVDAVACAVAIQKAVSERNSTMVEAERIVFRIGINLGDVALVDGDVYGDGVNVAARLEQLCDPSGVLISGTAYDHLKGKLDLRLEPRGVQHLKNIHEPVRVYRVASIGAGSARCPTREAASVRERVARRWRWVAAASLTLLLLLALAAWLRPWQPAVEAAALERMAFPLPDKPSIAVLPFKNLSGEAEQEYFVDGLTDDLITDLSKISGLFVIARNSVFELKGRDVKVHQAAERLGVRYVVEGSVRRAGNDVRINVQLVDATTGGQLWAERYDGSLGDVFAVQDRFVRVIVDALALNLSQEEEREIGRGQTNNIDAREAFQRGWVRVLRVTAHENASGIADLHKAIELDPGYGRAYAALGLAYSRSCAWDWSNPVGVSRSQACELALRYADEAKRRPSPLAHIAATQLDLYNRHYDSAMTNAARAIALDPNDPEAHIVMAWVMIGTGKPQTGLEFVRTAMRLDPSQPSHYALARGVALFATGALDEAARVFEEALQRHPSATELAPPLAAIYAQRGRREDARALLLRWQPGASQDELSNAPFAYQMVHGWSPEEQEVVDRLVDGLIIAALPPDVTVATLADGLKEGGPFARGHAARTLGRFGPLAAEAVPALVAALEDESPVVRGAAIIALGKIGPNAKAAIPALTAIQDDRLQPLAANAVKAISGI